MSKFGRLSLPRSSQARPGTPSPAMQAAGKRGLPGRGPPAPPLSDPRRDLGRVGPGLVGHRYAAGRRNRPISCQQSGIDDRQTV